MKRAVAEHAHPAHPHDVLMPKKRHSHHRRDAKPVVVCSSSPFPPARLPLFSLENDGEDEEEEEGGDDDAYGAVAVI